MSLNDDDDDDDASTAMPLVPTAIIYFKWIIAFKALRSGRLVSRFHLFFMKRMDVVGFRWRSVGGQMFVNFVVISSGECKYLYSIQVLYNIKRRP